MSTKRSLDELNKAVDDLGGGGAVAADTLKVEDTRTLGDTAPDLIPERLARAEFKNDVAGSPFVWSGSLTLKGWNSTYAAWQLIGNADEVGNNTDLYYRTGRGASWDLLQKVWTDNNDGVGSGLDADLLDGLQGTSYARLSSANVFSNAQEVRTPSSFGLVLDRSDNAINETGIIFRQAAVNSWKLVARSDSLQVYNFANGGGSTGNSLYISRDTHDATFLGNVIAYSDARLKTDILQIPNALNKVLQIRGYTYLRTDIKGGARQTGVIAQEVLEVLPEAVIAGEDGMLSVAYGNMVGLLVEAFKDLNETNHVLSERITALEEVMGHVSSK